MGLNEGFACLLMCIKHSLFALIKGNISVL